MYNPNIQCHFQKEPPPPDDVHMENFGGSHLTVYSVVTLLIRSTSPRRWNEMFKRNCYKGRRCMWPVNIHMNPAWRRLEYLSNQLVEWSEVEEWESCVTPALSLYNFRPHFPQRPLNLTAIWRFAPITIHSWVKINLWDSSLGQGFWRLATTCARLCAAPDNLLWFILSAHETPHIICKKGAWSGYTISSSWNSRVRQK